MSVGNTASREACEEERKRRTDAGEGASKSENREYVQRVRKSECVKTQLT